MPAESENPIADGLRPRSRLDDIQLPDRAELTNGEMQQIAQQAQVLFREIYVHLQLKQSIHAANPLDRLRALIVGLKRAPMPEAEFHDEMVSIFTALRDLHTVYVLPDPYPGKIAFLPFMIEECHDGGRSRFVISKLDRGFDVPGFVRGAEVIAWNGIPITRAVELNGHRRPGSNRSARRARAIDALTFRWLGTSSRPDEDEVTITYRPPDGGPGKVIGPIPWWVAERPGDPPLRDRSSERWSARGVDVESEWIRRVKRALFAGEPAVATIQVSASFPEVFRYGRLPDERSPFGYLRIHTFDVDDEAGFHDEAVRILRELPRSGVIVDVRGNSGGSIPAAERLLQLFTTRRIEPEPLRFRNTGLTLDLTMSRGFELGGRSARKRSLVGSIRSGGYTGEPFSAGYSLDPEHAYNVVDDADRYPGPVVLIVDGLSYSATEIFAAGFQDHGLGVVLGTAPQTGGGGANVWSFESMRDLLGIERGLPHNASFTMAVRASSRVGPRAGYPLEDLGVSADFVHWPSMRDVLDGNRDLYASALAILADMHTTRLAIP